MRNKLLIGNGLFRVCYNSNIGSLINPPSSAQQDLIGHCNWGQWKLTEKACCGHVTKSGFLVGQAQIWCLLQTKQDGYRTLMVIKPWFSFLYFDMLYPYLHSCVVKTICKPDINHFHQPHCSQYLILAFI